MEKKRYDYIDHWALLIHIFKIVISVSNMLYFHVVFFCGKVDLSSFYGGVCGAGGDCFFVNCGVNGRNRKEMVGPLVIAVGWILFTLID